jgi:hypothetical protein
MSAIKSLEMIDHCHFSINASRGRIIGVVGGSAGMMVMMERAIYPSFCCTNQHSAIHSCFHGSDALKTHEMMDPCHLSLNASRGRIIGVVGGSGHDSHDEESNCSFFLL